MRTRGPVVGAGLLLVLLSGCGGVEPEPSTPAEPDASAATADTSAATTDASAATRDAPAGHGAKPWLTADGDTLVTCGGPAFPASRVAEGGLELTPEEAEEILAVLDQMKQDFGMDAPRPLQEAEADEVPWAVMWQESVAGTDRVGILMAEPGATEFSLDTDEFASLEWTGESWRASSWSGTCGARPALPSGLAWAQVALPEDPAASRDTADRTASTVSAGASFDLLVSEIDCTSARDPEPHLAEPVVVETAESVTVYWTTEPMTGGADCPGNPWVARSVTVEEPLGERDLLDGSTYPPQVVRTVEEIESGPPA